GVGGGDPPRIDGRRPRRSAREPPHSLGGSPEGDGGGARRRPGDEGARGPGWMTFTRRSTMLNRRVALALIAAALVSVAPAAPPAPRRRAGSCGLFADAVAMDPPQISDLNSTRVIKRMFEGLTAQELGTYKIVPGLVEKWDISKDGLLYTFYLRPNVKFHDG